MLHIFYYEIIFEGVSMDSCKYLDKIECKLNKYFDINKNIYLLTEKIDLFAKYRSLNSLVLLSSDNVMDSYETNEFIILKSLENISSDQLENFINYIKKCSSTLVYPNKNHKCSIVNGIIISNNSLDKAIADKVNKFKYVRPHKLYFHGWTEIRLMIVDLSNKTLIHSKNCPDSIKVFQCFD